MDTETLTGYHGTSEDCIAEIRKKGFMPGTRTASWLGFGAYFSWESPETAIDWARFTAARRSKSQGKVLKGALFRVSIELRNCMNLLDDKYWGLLKEAYAAVPGDVTQVGPSHIYNPNFTNHSKVGFNYRDCAAVNSLAQNLEASGVAVDSVIAAFAEGAPLGQDSWLFDQSAVMISVRNPSRIKILSHSIVDP